MFIELKDKENNLKCSGYNCHTGYHCPNQVEYILYLDRIKDFVPTPYCRKCKEWFEANTPNSYKE